MAISNRTISKFVKATKNETKNTKREKTVYGKIVARDNMVYYALIDGATYDESKWPDKTGLVPISRFTSDVNVEDKVIITIKDHTAIVTGNVSNPSTDPVNVKGKIEEAISEVKTSSIALEDIRALWGVK